jgi:hypothetical protein
MIDDIQNPDTIVREITKKLRSSPMTGVLLLVYFVSPGNLFILIFYQSDYFPPNDSPLIPLAAVILSMASCTEFRTINWDILLATADDASSLYCRYRYGKKNQLMSLERISMGSLFLPRDRQPHLAS